MTASDTAWPTSDTTRSMSVSGTGWPAAELAPPPQRNALWDDSRVRAHRQLWLPPGRLPRSRQALGRPYVWDGGEAGPPNGRHAGRGPATSPVSAVSAELTVSAEPTVRAEPTASAEPRVPTEPRAPAGHGTPADNRPAVGSADALTGTAVLTERAIIGDRLRQLAAWCQIGACIARHTDAGALGEADIRARAVAAGWCVDLFGRLVCPSCQQIHPVWSARPAVLRGLWPAVPRGPRPAVPRGEPGSWPVGGADFQIGRHRRTYAASQRRLMPPSAGWSRR